MILAIWTLKAPKVEWIKIWVNTCPYFSTIKDKVEYILESVPSDISDMPLSIEETMTWAKNRAQNLKKKWIIADYYIWIEWWTTDIMSIKYIGWIVYIENFLWEWHFWFSPMLEVPKKVEKMLYEEKLELGPVMSKLSWITNIQSQNGSMWAWSNDMFTRKDEFEDAFKSAIAPFYNTFYKLK
jgi:non-canonical (house-cleaning) NTP pyrophosphatase